MPLRTGDLRARAAAAILLWSMLGEVSFDVRGQNLARLSGTEKNLARLRLQLTEAHSDKDVEKLRDQIFLVEQFRSVTPEVSILKAREHQVITGRQLQSSLSNSEALLEYVVDDPASYCLVITRTSIRIVKLPGGQELSSLVVTYLNKLKRKARADE